MATIKVAPSGAIESISVDGVDVTPHVLADPPPRVVSTGGRHGIFAVDVRLVLERPRKAAPPKPVDTTEGTDAVLEAPERPRRLCEEHIHE